MSLRSLELKILIINFLYTKFKIALKTLQAENFKRHVMTKITPYHTTTEEASMPVQVKFESKTIQKSPNQTG